MNPQLIFGDIFTINKQEFIFLGKTLYVLYAAKILDIETSKEVQRIFFKKLVTSKKTDGPLFCYTKLATLGFKDRIASLIQPTLSLDVKYVKTSFKVCDDDETSLVKEILDSRAIPAALKELFPT